MSKCVVRVFMRSRAFSHVFCWICTCFYKFPHAFTWIYIFSHVPHVLKYWYFFLTTNRIKSPLSPTYRYRRQEMEEEEETDYEKFDVIVYALLDSQTNLSSKGELD